MSATVTERARTAVRGRTAAIPAQRGIAEGAAPAVPATDPTAVPGAGQPGRRSALQKAYARRDDRMRRVSGLRPARAATPAGRPQFVLLIMVLLAVGLVATLWLSTAAAADSYRLQDATGQARVLSEQAERLHQEVAVLASAPELARRAGELGMVPVRDPARLVVAPDGSVEVVGEPRAAVPPPPPVPPAPVDGSQPPVPGGAEGTTPESTPSDGTGPDGAPSDDAAQLPGPGGDGDTPAASAEETRGDEAGGDGAGGADAERRSGQNAAGEDATSQDTAGQDTAGQDGRGEPGTAPQRRAADGTEAGQTGSDTEAGGGPASGQDAAPDSGPGAGGGTDAG
jgi:hypothetical protein